jgi:biotin-(acetyl-CoA carboxylase) ligase
MQDEQQDSLPTLEQTNIPELTQAAREYRIAIEDRMRIQREREGPFKAKVLAIMHTHNLTVYKDDHVRVEIKPGDEKVKVKLDEVQVEEES